MKIKLFLIALIVLTALTNKPTIPTVSIGSTGSFVKTLFGNNFMFYTQTITLNGTSLTFITDVAEF